MQNQSNPELDAFLKEHADIEMFEVILVDVGGILRGKWLERSKIHKVFEGGLKLPLTTLSLDIWGRDVEKLTFDSGDGDGICRPDINTLAWAPWLKRPTGQILLSLDELNGQPCSYDPRQIVKQLSSRLAEHGLTPVIAFEMEFYLLQDGENSLGQPLHTQSDSLSGMLKSGQTYGIDLMNEMSDFMHAVRDACHIQGLPIDTLIKEAAPSQYEINLHHSDNVLQAADHALMLQRVIQGVAKQHGYRATFMAKPYGDLAGNGKHVHCSLVDSEGDNAFDNQTDKGNELLHQSVAGCLSVMADSMLLFAPNLNSYRRFQSGSHAPLAPTWGYENRTVSLRIPADSHKAMRFEHRVAGADANPYLVTAAILAGILNGIENKLEAPEPVQGNAYDQYPPTLPRYMPDAIQEFSNSQFIAEYFGSEFQTIYTAVKQHELDQFDGWVTRLEYEANL